MTKIPIISRHLVRHPGLPSTRKDAHRKVSMKESWVRQKLWHENRVMAKTVSTPTHFMKLRDSANMCKMCVKYAQSM